MKAYLKFFALVGVAVLIAACGKVGSVQPGTYSLATDTGTYTVVLEKESFEYKAVDSDGTQFDGYKGDFVGFEKIDVLESESPVENLKEWDGSSYVESSSTDAKVAVINYSEDIGFGIDLNGDGTYSITEVNLRSGGLVLQ